MRSRNFLAALMFSLLSYLSHAMDDEKNIPNEMWLHIFSYLDYNAATELIYVNNYFYTALNNDSLWKKFISDSDTISNSVKSWRALAWSINKATHISIAGEECYFKKKNNIILSSIVNIYVSEIRWIGEFNRNAVFQHCILENPKVICFPFFLAAHSSRIRNESDSIVADLLNEALEKDIIVVMRYEPLPLREYPNVIRVHGSLNFGPKIIETTPNSSAIIRLDSEEEGCPIEKIAMLVAGFRSLRRDLSAPIICNLLETSSSKINGQEKLRTRIINQEQALSKILSY